MRIKTKTMSVLAAALVGSAVYANCIVDFQNTCQTNGQVIGTINYQGCSGVPPHTANLVVSGTWTKPDATLDLRGGFTAAQAMFVSCTGWSRSWNTCANSWDYYAPGVHFTGPHLTSKGVNQGAPCPMQ